MITFICGPDVFHECVVDGITYRWEFHEHMGPLFLRKDYEPLVRQPGPNNRVWPAFHEWLIEYEAEQKRTEQFKQQSCC